MAELEAQVKTATAYLINVHRELTEIREEIDEGTEPSKYLKSLPKLEEYKSKIIRLLEECAKATDGTRSVVAPMQNYANAVQLKLNPLIETIKKYSVEPDPKKSEQKNKHVDLGEAINNLLKG